MHAGIGDERLDKQRCAVLRFGDASCIIAKGAELRLECIIWFQRETNAFPSVSEMLLEIQ